MKKYDAKNLDTNVRPQDDFFKYAVGGWIKRNPIPSEKAKWGTFYVLRERVAKDLHTIVKDAVARKVGLARVPAGDSLAVGDSEEQQLRDFFRSGMDMKIRNTRGIQPIVTWLELIDTIQDRDTLISAIIRLHADGFSPLFSVFVGQDDKQSTKYITHITQNGITLGEKDFYLKKGARNEEIRKALITYAQRLFTRAGIQKDNAEKDAQTLLSFETVLAKISMGSVDRRDITKTYHKFTLSQWERDCVDFPWQAFMKNQGLQKVTSVVVQQPDYIKKAILMVRTRPISSWKIYLRFHILDTMTDVLTEGFEKDSFAFYGKVLSGVEKQEPLWKRVLGTVNGCIGDILGKEYTRRHFPPEAKNRINELVDDLFNAYETRIKTLDWMSSETKKKALKKLSRMNKKLGYPDKWRSYAGLHIDPTDFVGNVFRAALHERHYQYSRIGKPVDFNEWFMHPHDVNAYYHPNMNDIAFPAAILQWPFFSTEQDDAFNYGAIGSIIGHEITHGFDDQGCMFDGMGNYKNWWTVKDKKAFDRKAKVLVHQFNEYRIHGERVNGLLTLGENIADLGGLSIAFDAYMNHIQKHGGDHASIGGYTPEQRFFLGYALGECGHYRKENALTMLVVDPHSPSELRVNAPVSNLPEFYTAFDVRKEHALFRTEKTRAKIW